MIEAPAAAGEATSEAPVNLNSASLQALMSLPKVGKVTAQKLIDARPLDSLEAAREASGMTDAAWQEIEARLSL